MAGSPGRLVAGRYTCAAAAYDDGVGPGVRPHPNVAGPAASERWLATDATVRTTVINVGAVDGVSLAATLYEADTTSLNADRPVVLVSSAAAVRRPFYDRFARFLADDGFTVLTYDYRGIGDSRPS